MLLQALYPPHEGAITFATASDLDYMRLFWILGALLLVSPVLLRLLFQRWQERERTPRPKVKLADVVIAVLARCIRAKRRIVASTRAFCPNRGKPLKRLLCYHGPRQAGAPASLDFAYRRPVSTLPCPR